ncbi:hypothetical protein MKX03_012898, partial [Papaver bracteatum]
DPDTSVIVWPRSSWEHIRSCIAGNGFKVYVCTGADQKFALEMWRLLDPESTLIDSDKLLDRIVCVKS